jgi:hypothetical protein
MFGYLFWSVAALFGAVWTIKLLITIPADKTNLRSHIFYTAIHAVLLCGACVMALGIFGVTLTWTGKLTILVVVLLHNGFSLWQIGRNEK